MDTFDLKKILRKGYMEDVLNSKGMEIKNEYGLFDEREMSIEYCIKSTPI